MEQVSAAVPLPDMGREAGTAALFRHEHGRLVAYARLLVDDQQTAEDFVQEAFLGLYRRWSGRRTSTLLSPTCAPPSSTAPVASCAGDARRGPSGPPRRSSHPWAEALAVRPDEHRLLVDALGRLPGRQRDVLVLRYFFDLTEAQIAAELEITRGSVKQHASRGLAALTAGAGLVQ